MAEPLSVGNLARIACLFVVTARYPGNVHRFADFNDCGYLDFALSAQAIGDPIDRLSDLGLGATILEAVKATRSVVSTNTNLGMLLLLVPLAAVPLDADLRIGVGEILRSTTVDDAKHVYEAIRLAKPGGLGQADSSDVREEPKITLIEAMRLASERDAVALQYVSDYQLVFEVGLVALKESLDEGFPLEAAIIRSHLSLLAACPDTLIARKLGEDEAGVASRWARLLLQTSWSVKNIAISPLQKFDEWLRERGHDRNPGTTADLVAASLFVALREGVIRLPLDRPFQEPMP